MIKRLLPIAVALLFACPAAWTQGPDLIFQDGFDPPLAYPDGAPFQDYVIAGTAIYGGPVTSWQWTVTSDSPCDELLYGTTGFSTFTLTGATTPTLTLRPSLSGDYTVHVAIATDAGPTILRSFVVHIAGPGLRVEMCSDRSDTTDLDLHVHSSGVTTPWFTADDCYYANCDAFTPTPVNWGHPASSLAECAGGPDGAGWQALGFCRNPRLEIDSINEAGMPENTNLDNPVDGATHRVMVHYWSGTGVVRPVVSIYCGGQRKATFGVAPDVVPGFDQSGGNPNGDLWRVADVTITSGGADCTVAPIHPPGMTEGYWVTSGSVTY
jgi:hypothetical protein